MAESKSMPLHRVRVIWRVMAPAAGNDDGDTTLLETQSELAARHSYERLRLSRWPVRLEQVRCGLTLLREERAGLAREERAGPASCPPDSGR
jgi:hypothetical protein